MRLFIPMLNKRATVSMYSLRRNNLIRQSSAEVYLSVEYNSYSLCIG